MRTRRLWLLAALFLPMTAVIGRTGALAQAASGPQAVTMKIRIDINGTRINGTLENNPTARDFASLLPVTVTLNDHARTEKTASLPRPLSTAGAPPGADPSVGDIAYYAPWGNLALYYRDFGYSSGLIKLGEIDASALSRSSSGQATISLAGD